MRGEGRVGERRKGNGGEGRKGKGGKWKGEGKGCAMAVGGWTPLFTTSYTYCPVYDDIVYVLQNTIARA